MTADAAEDAIDLGRRLFARPCTFIAAAATLDALPDPTTTEIAFAGRSNVGKSSLLNALVGRKGLARISATPGRTQQINFFDLGGVLILVDLPGYGYARAPKAAASGWTRLTHAYLRGRPTLRRLCLLIDARHGLKDSDREVMALLDQAAVSYQAVLTKIDKVKPAALEALRGALAPELARHVACHPEIIATSAVTGAGIPELRAALAALAAPEHFS
ncbi:MAG TPA: ribosome biogenesis GTP-binding protein YihA/YsxC [Alphaproteobacteria bacterium]